MWVVYICCKCDIDWQYGLMLVVAYPPTYPAGGEHRLRSDWMVPGTVSPDE